ncbi:hypothetical protein N9C59_04130 [Flavobacteriales bacterium]|jgi:hypothetical protein|nr:hypothetical protein [Flavobacteriales bacterium]
MKFSNRLKFYLIGFSLGLFLVYSIFKDRSWNWLPENKVKQFLLENPLRIYTDKNQQTYQKDISKNIFDIIINGDVNFSKSKTDSSLKKYVIEYEEAHACFGVSFEDSLCRVLSLNKINFNLKNDSLSLDSIIHIDQVNLTNRFSKMEKKFTKAFIVKLRNSPLNTEDFLKNLESFNVDWNTSLPFKKLNPQYSGTIKISNITYQILLETGNKKLRFKDFNQL